MSKEIIECPSCGEISLKPIKTWEECSDGKYRPGTIWTEYECECGHYQQSPSKAKYSVSLSMKTDLWTRAIQLLDSAISVEISKLVNESWQCSVMDEDCSWHHATDASQPKAIIDAFDKMDKWYED